MSLTYILDHVWQWGTGMGTGYGIRGTETGTGHFHFSKYGVRTEYRINLILSSTDGVRKKNALNFWCGYGTGYGRFSKSRCGYGFRTRTCTPEYDPGYIADNVWAQVILSLNLAGNIVKRSERRSVEVLIFSHS